jgi:hypothetical protein
MTVRQVAVVILVTVGTFSILVSVAQTSEHAIVKVQQGLLKGKILTSVRSKTKFLGFLGIPYAKPPVGELKFKVTSETSFSKTACLLITTWSSQYVRKVVMTGTTLKINFVFDARKSIRTACVCVCVCVCVWRFSLILAWKDSPLYVLQFPPKITPQEADVLTCDVGSTLRLINVDSSTLYDRKS